MRARQHINVIFAWHRKQMVDAASSVDREALRRKLRNKIHHKRENRGSDVQQIGRRMKDDPTTTLLSMGVDDPSVLEHAKTIMKHPTTALRTLTSEIAVAAQRLPTDASDDEEAPPPIVQSDVEVAAGK